MRAILFVFVFSLIISCSQSKFEPIEMEADVAILAASVAAQGLAALRGSCYNSPWAGC